MSRLNPVFLSVQGIDRRFTNKFKLLIVDECNFHKRPLKLFTYLYLRLINVQHIDLRFTKKITLNQITVDEYNCMKMFIKLFTYVYLRFVNV